MNKLKIIFDTDIGDDIDDAFALYMLLNTPQIEIIGITTVYKNTLMRGKIAKYIVNLFNKKIPVHVGENLPFVDKINYFDFEAFMEDGTPIIAHYLAEMKDSYVEDENAIDFILKQIENDPDEITILALGPLTNLAKAYLKNPETFKKVKEIVLMGTSLLDDYPEWNIRCDSKAAEIVFSSKVPMRVIGLDVTKKCNMSKEYQDYFLNLKDERNATLSKMLKIWLQDRKFKIAPVMHDPLAASCLIKDFCEFETRNVIINPNGRGGYTCISPEEKDSTKVSVALNVDCDGFYQYLIECIKDQ